MTEIEHYQYTFVREALPIIRSTGEYIAQQLIDFDSTRIEQKEKNSLVSYVDKTAEIQLVKGLSSLFKDCGFITEEDVTETIESDLTWIIDPLDGTTNFLQQIPIFCVSVALRYQDELIAGAIYDPMRKEMFYATDGGGAYLNGKNIKASAKNDLSQSIVATGFPYHDMTLLEQHIGMLRDVLTNGRGVRRLGSAALDLAYVACGRFDVFYEHTLNIWDIAAGIVLVREAGGKVSDYFGTQKQGETGRIVSSNGHLHEDILVRIRTHIL